MMYTRLFGTRRLFLAGACGAAEGETQDSATSEWWEDGSTTDSETTTVSSNGETASDTGTDTSDKPDDFGDYDGDKPDDTGEAAGEAWGGVIDTAAGTGTLTYSNTTTTGEDCQLSFAVLEAAALDTCDSCSFAWELGLGDVTITQDAGGCGASAELANQNVRYGQGSAVLTEYAGITYYELFASGDGETWENRGGYSSVDGTSWTFGTK